MQIHFQRYNAVQFLGSDSEKKKNPHQGYIYLTNLMHSCWISDLFEKLYIFKTH